MRPDIDDLQSFYATRQGQLARRLIHHQLKALWPDLGGRTVLGFGTRHRSCPGPTAPRGPSP